MRKLVLSFVVMFSSVVAYSQVGIGTLTPDQNAQLEVKAEDKGILIPRVRLTSLTDRGPIRSASPMPNSLLVFNLTTNSEVKPGYYYWFTDRWQRVTTEQEVRDINTINQSLSFRDGANGEKVLVLKDSDDREVAVGMKEVIESLETLTALTYTDGVLVYTDEDKQATRINLKAGDIPFTAIDATPNADGTPGTNGVNATTIQQAITLLNQKITEIQGTKGNLTGDKIIEVANGEKSVLHDVALSIKPKSITADKIADGTITSDKIDSNAIKNLETLTVLSYNNSILSYKDEAGNVTNIPFDAGNITFVNPPAGGNNGGAGDNGTGGNNGGAGDNGTGGNNGGTGDNGTGDNGTGDNGTGDNGTGDNGTGDNGTGGNNGGTGENNNPKTIRDVINTIQKEIKEIQGTKGTLTVADFMKITHGELKEETTSLADAVLKNLTISVKVASSENLGVVKQAKDKPTVQISEDGVLSVNTTNITDGLDGGGITTENVVINNPDGSTTTVKKLKIDAENGIHIDDKDNKLKLGGDLTKATEITTTDANTLAIKGLQDANKEQDLLVMQNTDGVLRKHNTSEVVKHHETKTSLNYDKAKGVLTYVGENQTYTANIDAGNIPFIDDTNNANNNGGTGNGTGNNGAGGTGTDGNDGGAGTGGANGNDGGSGNNGAAGGNGNNGADANAPKTIKDIIKEIRTEINEIQGTKGTLSVDNFMEISHTEEGQEKKVTELSEAVLKDLKLSVKTASANNLGVVKQAKDKPTVEIAEDGTLSVNTTNITDGLDGGGLEIEEDENGKKKLKIKAKNGIKVDTDDYLKLGGALTEAETKIEAAADKTLAISGLQVAKEGETDVFVVQDATTSVLRKRTLDAANIPLAKPNNNNAGSGTGDAGTGGAGTGSGDTGANGGSGTGTDANNGLTSTNVQDAINELNEKINEKVGEINSRKGKLTTNQAIQINSEALKNGKYELADAVLKDTELTVKAGNGLAVDTNEDSKGVILGGTLDRATELVTDNTNTLAIKGLQDGAKEDVMVVQNAQGVLKKRVLSADNVPFTPKTTTPNNGGTTQPGAGNGAGTGQGGDTSGQGGDAGQGGSTGNNADNNAIAADNVGDAINELNDKINEKIKAINDKVKEGSVTVNGPLTIAGINAQNGKSVKENVTLAPIEISISPANGTTLGVVKQAEDKPTVEIAEDGTLSVNTTNITDGLDGGGLTIEEVTNNNGGNGPATTTKKLKVNAKNGINVGDDGFVKLGGALTEATTITTATDKTLAIKDLQKDNEQETTNVMVVQDPTTGVLKNRTLNATNLPFTAIADVPEVPATPGNGTDAGTPKVPAKPGIDAKNVQEAITKLNEKLNDKIQEINDKADSGTLTVAGPLKITGGTEQNGKTSKEKVTLAPVEITVATANGTALGVVKQAETDPTVTINDKGELAVNTNNIRNNLSTDLAGNGLVTNANGYALDVQAGNGIVVDNDRVKANLGEGLKFQGDTENEKKITLDIQEKSGLAIIQSTGTDNGKLRVLEGDGIHFRTSDGALEVSASQGLTATAGGVQLGGTLTEEREINVNSQNFKISNLPTANDKHTKVLMLDDQNVLSSKELSADNVAFTQADGTTNPIGATNVKEAIEKLNEKIVTNTTNLTKGNLTSTDITITGDNNGDGTEALFKNITLAIASNAVTTEKINDGAVTEDKLGAGAVTENKLGDNAVTTNKINNGAVTENKLGAGAVTETKLGDNAVTTNKIKDGAVTENKLATDAVTTEKIKNGAITGEKIADGTITAGKIGGKQAVTATGPIKVNGGTQVADAVLAAVAISVDNANGTTLGVVKEAATNATVKINAQGELSVDTSAITGGLAGDGLTTETTPADGTTPAVTKLKIDADNGLSVVGGKVGLGGNLDRVTTITTTDTKTLAIAGLQDGTKDDNLVVQGTDGVLKKLAISSAVAESETLTTLAYTNTTGTLTYTAENKQATAIDLKAGTNFGVVKQSDEATASVTITDGIVSVKNANGKTQAGLVKEADQNPEIKVADGILTIADEVITGRKIANNSIEAEKIKDRGNITGSNGITVTSANNGNGDGAALKNVTISIDSNTIGNNIADNTIAPGKISGRQNLLGDGTITIEGGTSAVLSTTKVKVATASTTLGVVKQAATNPTVAIAQDGTLSVSTDNIKETLATDLAGAGLVKNGSQLDVQAGDGIVVDNDRVKADLGAGLTFDGGAEHSKKITLDIQPNSGLAIVGGTGNDANKLRVLEGDGVKFDNNGAISVLAENGLTATTDGVKLGGTLKDETTTINVNNKTLQLTNLPNVTDEHKKVLVLNNTGDLSEKELNADNIPFTASQGDNSPLTSTNVKAAIEELNNRIATNTGNITKRNLTSNDITVSNGTGAVFNDVTLAIAADAITSEKIKNETITESDLANSAVTETKIKDNAVTEDKIKNDAVTTAKIKDNAVTSNKIANGAVTADKIGGRQSITKKGGNDNAIEIEGGSQAVLVDTKIGVRLANGTTSGVVKTSGNAEDPIQITDGVISLKDGAISADKIKNKATLQATGPVKVNNAASVTDAVLTAVTISVDNANGTTLGVVKQKAQNAKITITNGELDIDTSNLTTDLPATNGGLTIEGGKLKIQAKNGVKVDTADGFVKLGGDLTEATTITTDATKTLTLAGLQEDANATKVVVTDNVGKLATKTFTLKNYLQGNGITIGTGNSPVISANIDTNKAIEFDNATNGQQKFGVKANTAKGIIANADGVAINNGKGIDFDNNKLVAKGENGITIDNTKGIILGGDLTQATTIGTTADKTLTLAGLQQGGTTDTRVLVTDNNGKVAYKEATDIGRVYTAENGVQISNSNVISAVAKNNGAIDTNGGISVKRGNGIETTDDNIAVKPKANGGILVTADGVAVNKGNGLDTTADAVVVKAKPNSAINVTSAGVEVLADSGVQVDTSVGKVRLGGSLERPTTIEASTANHLKLQGLDPDTSTDTTADSDLPTVMVTDKNKVVKTLKIPAAKSGYIANPWFKASTELPSGKVDDKIYHKDRVAIGNHNWQDSDIKSNLVVRSEWKSATDPGTNTLRLELLREGTIRSWDLNVERENFTITKREGGNITDKRTAVFLPTGEVELGAGIEAGTNTVDVRLNNSIIDSDVQPTSIPNSIFAKGTAQFQGLPSLTSTAGNVNLVVATANGTLAKKPFALKNYSAGNGIAFTGNDPVISADIDTNKGLEFTGNTEGSKKIGVKVDNTKGIDFDSNGKLISKNPWIKRGTANDVAYEKTGNIYRTGRVAIGPDISNVASAHDQTADGMLIVKAPDDNPVLRLEKAITGGYFTFMKNTESTWANAIEEGHYTFTDVTAGTSGNQIKRTFALLKNGEAVFGGAGAGNTNADRGLTKGNGENYKVKINGQVTPQSGTAVRHSIEASGTAQLRGLTNLANNVNTAGIVVADSGNVLNKVSFDTQSLSLTNASLGVKINTSKGLGKDTNGVYVKLANNKTGANNRKEGGLVFDNDGDMSVNIDRSKGLQIVGNSLRVKLEENTNQNALVFTNHNANDPDAGGKLKVQVQNGLYIGGSNIKLGGNLTEETTIDFKTFKLWFKTTENKKQDMFGFEGPNDKKWIFGLDEGNLILFKRGDVGKRAMVINRTGTVFIGDGVENENPGANHDKDVILNRALNVNAAASASTIDPVPNGIEAGSAKFRAMPGLEKSDKLVVADSAGVLGTVTRRKNQFYMPSVVLPTTPNAIGSGDTALAGTSHNGGTYTVNLYAIYANQFGTAVKSNQNAALQTYTESQLDYFVTYYDATVFENVAISNAGVLTYRVKANARVTERTFMNIVFQEKW